VITSTFVETVLDPNCHQKDLKIQVLQGVFDSNIVHRLLTTSRDWIKASLFEKFQWQHFIWLFIFLYSVHAFRISVTKEEFTKLHFNGKVRQQ